jgi:hypothetical protein
LTVLAGFAAVLSVSAARRLRTALTGPIATRRPVPSSS